jgi:putative hydrolase of the HAD superfamily
MRNKKHLFFDLDRTLWDYESNAKEVLLVIYKHYLADTVNFDFTLFAETFGRENSYLWAAFSSNKIDKTYLRKFRFYNTLSALGMPDFDLSTHLEVMYLAETPLKTKLLPGVHETLSVLQQKYTLHIITNGFEGVQEFKLVNSGIRHYFSTIVTSDSAGARKPNREIFEFSTNQINATQAEVLIIGDDLEIDILGAKAAGWDGIYFNPIENPLNDPEVKEIRSLTDLLNLL